MAPTAFFYLLLSITLCSAALFTQISQLPKTTFDFVIVGGGTAGNVIANRLTENPKVSVLVIEAGPSNEGVTDSDIPFLTRNLLPPGPFNWNYTTVPQVGLNNRVIPYARGHILGGSSAINIMVYTRGTTDDWDRYANVTGDQGFSWSAMQKYFKKNELWNPPTDVHNTTGQFDPRIHSTSGLNGVSLNSFPSPADDRIIMTTKQLPNNFPFNLDMNSGKPLGLSWNQNTIFNGKRSTSATSYLGPKFINRPNLFVLVNARVTRILQSSTGKASLVFNIVEVSQSTNKAAPRSQIQATKEVILSAGSIGTPQILMNSGIGDKNELEALGIPSILNLPSVGKNSSDHTLMGIDWTVNAKYTLDNLAQPAALKTALATWQATHQGPLTINPFGVTHLAWTRLPENSTAFQTVFADPSAGRNSPHIELIISGNGAADPVLGEFGNTIAITVAQLTPVSRGSVTLSSNDPLADPVIDPAFLREPFDLIAFREGVKQAMDFFTAPVWKDYIIGLAGTIANANSDDEIDQVIKDNAGTVWHLVGTAMMTPSTANWGVVNPDFRVKGVPTGLRIVDASVFPFIPSSHTQAPVYAFAERASDIIKSTWKLSTWKLKDCICSLTGLSVQRLTGPTYLC